MPKKGIKALARGQTNGASESVDPSAWLALPDPVANVNGNGHKPRFLLPAEQRKKNRIRSRRVTEVKLRRAQHELTARAERIAELEGRVAELEAQLASGGSVPPQDQVSDLGLNTATFEDLRRLGLSITQCTRVIAARDVRGGFSSAEDVAEVPGLSGKTVELLRAL
jgi:DNA uptake protein ComE-like DNA-binding protein